MKVEKISEFANKISNVKLLKDLIRSLLDKTDEEINMIKETLDKYNYDELLVTIIINTNKGITTEVVVKIVDAVGKCEDKKTALDIAKNETVQKNRTFQEIIELIEAVDKCEDKFTAFCIAIDVNVQENRTVPEIIELIEAVDKCECKCKWTEDIAENEYVQKNRTVSEIVELIEAVGKCEDKFTAFCIAIDVNVQENRTVPEIIEMIEAVDKCEVEEMPYNITVGEYVLYRTMQRAKKIIESTEKEVKTNTNEKLVNILNNIKTSKEFERYFKKLNDNGVNDVTSKTIVPVNKPNKKRLIL